MGDFWDQTASSMVRLGSVANLQRLGLERFHCIAVHVQYAHAHTTAFCIFLQFQSESRKGPSRLLFNIERIAAIIGQDVLRDMVYVQRNIGELCSTLVIQWYIPLCPGHFGTSTVLIIKISSFQGLKLFYITE